MTCSLCGEGDSRTTSPGPRTPRAAGLHAGRLCRDELSGLHAQRSVRASWKTQEGPLDGWGGALCAEPGPRGPQDRLSWSVPPHPWPQGQMLHGRCRGNAEFPGRTQGSERNHKAGRAPPGSLLPGGAWPCGLYGVSVWGWGLGPAPLRFLPSCGRSRLRPRAQPAPPPALPQHPRSHWAAGAGAGRVGGVCPSVSGGDSLLHLPGCRKLDGTWPDSLG